MFLLAQPRKQGPVGIGEAVGIKPLRIPNMSSLSMRELLEAVHISVTNSFLEPARFPVHFRFPQQDSHHQLEKTVAKFDEAAKFLTNLLRKARSSSLVQSAHS